MKKIILTITLLFLSACSTFNPKVETLKESPVCTVWKEDILGGRHPVEVKEEQADMKVTCWVMNMFACTYDHYTFVDKNTIQSSIMGSKVQAKLEGNKMTLDSMGVTVDPFVLKNGRAEYMIQGPVGPKHSSLVEYNDKCTVRQAALGFMAVMGQ